MTLLTKSEFCRVWDITRPTLDARLKDPKCKVELKIGADGKKGLDPDDGIRMQLKARPQQDKKVSAVEVSQAGELQTTKVQIELLERLLRSKEDELQRALADKEDYRKKAERVALIEDQRDQAVIEATRAKAAADNAEERRRDFTQKITKLTDEFEKRAADDQRQRRKLEAKIAAIEERGLIARLFNWKHDP